MTVVDASVWVSILAADDANHEQSRQWFEQHLDTGRPILAPALALVEVAAAVTRRTNDPSTGMLAAKRVRITPELRLLDLTAADAEYAMEAAARLILRGADAVYVAAAMRLGVPLVTWDRQQRERAGSVIEVLTPAEALAHGR